MFTARYGLIPYIKQITFRLLKVKACPDVCCVLLYMSCTHIMQILLLPILPCRSDLLVLQFHTKWLHTPLLSKTHWIVSRRTLSTVLRKCVGFFYFCFSFFFFLFSFPCMFFDCISFPKMPISVMTALRRGQISAVVSKSSEEDEDCFV